MDDREKTVTGMAEYIEREAAQTSCRKYSFAESYDAFAVDCILKAIPAADVVLVRHGMWEEMHYEGGILDGTNFDRCSVCGYERVFDDPALKTAFKYCPNCGAKMEGGENDAKSM